MAESHQEVQGAIGSGQPLMDPKRRENRRKSSLAFTYEPDSDRGHFLRFMDESGVLRVFIETFTALYDEPIKPDNPAEWMRQYLWSRAKTTPRELRAEADRLRAQILRVAADCEEVNRRIRDRDPCGLVLTSAKYHHDESAGEGGSEEEEEGEGEDHDFIPSMVDQLLRGLVDHSTETSPQPSTTLLDHEEDDIRESTVSYQLRALHQGVPEGEIYARPKLAAVSPEEVSALVEVVEETSREPSADSQATTVTITDSMKEGKSGRSKSRRKFKSPKSTASQVIGGGSGKRSKKKRGGKGKGGDDGSKQEEGGKQTEGAGKEADAVAVISKSRIPPTLIPDFPFNYRPCTRPQTQVRAHAHAHTHTGENCIGPNFWSRGLNLRGEKGVTVTAPTTPITPTGTSTEQNPMVAEAGAGTSPPSSGGGVILDKDSLSYENLLAGHAPIKTAWTRARAQARMQAEDPDRPTSETDTGSGPLEEEYSWLPSILDAVPVPVKSNGSAED